MMGTRLLGLLLAIFLTPLGLVASQVPAQSQTATDRTLLPLPDTPSGGRAGLTINDSQMPRIEPIRPPAGAPNVVIVLLDDVGFGATGTFGGPVATPALDAIAAKGYVTIGFIRPLFARRHARPC